MKKLLYMLFLISTLFTWACETNSVSKITKGAKVIGRCCKELSAAGKSGILLKEENATAKPHDNLSPVLPAYFWDTKSTIW
jgi:hypothetical protein